jgi:hypothetical protein
MKEIALTRGFVAIVDDEDYEWLSATKWHYLSRGGYSFSNIRHPVIAGKWTTLLMHRAIMQMRHDDRREVDHIDGNRLNNCRANLRICSRMDNAKNKRRHADNSTCLKGVTRDRKRWMAQITANGVHMYLGSFRSPEEAHAAYRKAALELHGEFARFE